MTTPFRYPDGPHQGLRAHVATAGADSAGWLRALSDTQIGGALRLIHERPGCP
jgi:hypothetical protein